MKQVESELDSSDQADVETLLKNWSIKSREVEDMVWAEDAFAR
jgi:hypothetical protein